MHNDEFHFHRISTVNDVRLSLILRSRNMQPESLGELLEFFQRFDFDLFTVPRPAIGGGMMVQHEILLQLEALDQFPGDAQQKAVFRISRGSGFGEGPTMQVDPYRPW